MTIAIRQNSKVPHTSSKNGFPSSISWSDLKNWDVRAETLRMLPDDSSAKQELRGLFLDIAQNITKSAQQNNEKYKTRVLDLLAAGGISISSEEQVGSSVASMSATEQVHTDAHGIGTSRRVPIFGESTMRESKSIDEDIPEKVGNEQEDVSHNSVMVEIEEIKKEAPAGAFMQGLSGEGSSLEKEYAENVKASLQPDISTKDLESIRDTLREVVTKMKENVSDEEVSEKKTDVEREKTPVISSSQASEEKKRSPLSPLRAEVTEELDSVAAPQESDSLRKLSVQSESVREKKEEKEEGVIESVKPSEESTEKETPQWGSAIQNSPTEASPAPVIAQLEEKEMQPGPSLHENVSSGNVTETPAQVAIPVKNDYGGSDPYRTPIADEEVSGANTVLQPPQSKKESVIVPVAEVPSMEPVAESQNGTNGVTVEDAPIEKTENVPSPKAPESSATSVPEIDPLLMTPEVTAGLNDLLESWPPFAKSGLFGMGAHGSEHPLYQQINNLPVVKILKGSVSKIDKKVVTDIKEYVDAWEKEQGISPKEDEVFEVYLRRVIAHILENPPQKSPAK